MHSLKWQNSKKNLLRILGGWFNFLITASNFLEFIVFLDFFFFFPFGITTYLNPAFWALFASTVFSLSSCPVKVGIFSTGVFVSFEWQPSQTWFKRCLAGEQFAVSISTFGSAICCFISFNSFMLVLKSADIFNIVSCFKAVISGAETDLLIKFICLKKKENFSFKCSFELIFMYHICLVWINWILFWIELWRKNNRDTTLEKDIVLNGTEEPHTSRYASKQRQLKH